MKKVTALCLCSVFIAYLCGTQLVYWAKISVAQCASAILIKSNKVNPNQTREFEFKASEYNALAWSERNKEFTDKGVRYDIISTQYQSNGQIKLVCYLDKNESELVDAFSGFINKIFSSPTQSSKSGNDFSGKVYQVYLANKSFRPHYFSYIVTSFKADRALVNTSACISAIWHPPCA